MRIPRRLLSCIFLMLVVFATCCLTWTQEQNASPEQSCRNTTITSVPSRPTITNATETTQCGVIEFEYGLERQWPGGDANHDDLSGGIRFGITPNLDFHWSSSYFVHIIDAQGDRTSFGDTWLGLKYRFLKQKKYVPSLGVFYAAKIPTASFALNVGTGQVDHSLSLLISKDIGRVHTDFNVIELLAGRIVGSGSDHSTGFAWSASTPLTRRLSIVVEPYGYTLLNETGPSFAAAMFGFTYQARPRLYLDTGFDVGVSRDAPDKRVFAGVTYAAGNLYALLRPERH